MFGSRLSLARGRENSHIRGGPVNGSHSVLGYGIVARSVNDIAGLERREEFVVRLLNQVEVVGVPSEDRLTYGRRRMVILLRSCRDDGFLASQSSRRSIQHRLLTLLQLL